MSAHWLGFCRTNWEARPSAVTSSDTRRVMCYFVPLPSLSRGPLARWEDSADRKQLAAPSGPAALLCDLLAAATAAPAGGGAGAGVSEGEHLCLAQHLVPNDLGPGLFRRLLSAQSYCSCSVAARLPPLPYTHTSLYKGCFHISNLYDVCMYVCNLFPHPHPKETAVLSLKSLNVNLGRLSSPRF